MTINVTDFDFANQLMEAGAMWYCTKYPGDIDQYIYQPTDFVLSIFNAAEKRALHKEKLSSSQKLDQKIENILLEKQMVGSSESMQKLREQIEKASQIEATVLIHGRSGTGKELVATHIHYLSKRKHENFIPINCGSLPQELLESELFGFEKGSFTGAQAQKPGLLEMAHKGTAFLDEIGEFPPRAQVKMLRFLQEGEIDKIGRTENLKIDARIIAATNKDIEEEVKKGRFREDLYFRLNVYPIRVPPLSERREDINLLIQHFLEKFSREMGMETPGIDESALNFLDKYNWPGNVRELQNVVQRLLLSGNSPLGKDQVAEVLQYRRAMPGSDGKGLEGIWDGDSVLPLKEVEEKFRQHYFKFVREHSDSDAEAARKLGLAPPNYHRMCKELGLK
jgi:transcriptional regulator with GAF, ATPase, and Fis domain